MFLELSHTRMDVFMVSKELVLECYKLTSSFPTDEKFAMVQQIRRAALSVHLNIAEDCSRKSLVERKRFFEVSRGSVIEIDTALHIAIGLMYCTLEQLQCLGEKLISVFKMLSGLIGSAKNSHH